MIECLHSCDPSKTCTQLYMCRLIEELPITEGEQLLERVCSWDPGWIAGACDLYKEKNIYHISTGGIFTAKINSFSTCV